jgi:hypothetical protein
MKRLLILAFWLIGSLGAVLWTFFWLFGCVYWFIHAQQLWRCDDTVAVMLVLAGLGGNSLAGDTQSFKSHGRCEGAPTPVVFMAGKH